MVRRPTLLLAAILALGSSLSLAEDAPTRPEEHFAANVQPRLEFCRTCHVAGGIADVEDGRLFQLSEDTTEDYARVQDAWLVLGRGVESSRLLTMPSDPAVSHTGGKPWPLH